MAMTASRVQNLFKVSFHVLVRALEREKLEHPETYEAALRIGEEMRLITIELAGFDSLPALPR